MLTRAHRLTSTLDYSRVVRHGARFSAGTVVVHWVSAGQGRPRVGFVVSKGVGNAPQRNLVKRRLRAITRDNLGQISGDLVVRALPAAAQAPFEQLSDDLERCLAKVSARA